jgi:hypothetical protein
MYGQELSHFRCIFGDTKHHVYRREVTKIYVGLISREYRTLGTTLYVKRACVTLMRLAYCSINDSYTKNQLVCEMRYCPIKKSVLIICVFN